MNILIIGGTRNMGHLLAVDLLQAGHHVTVVNRGLTQDDLPPEVERFRADRTDSDQLKAALRGRSFDAVIDMVLYNGEEAEAIIKLLRGHVGHYVFISTGQVYLVREGLERPFSEANYEGLVMPAPKPNTYGYEEWSYGVHKREAEDALKAAWKSAQFPYTSLRIPMVNGERDPMNRLYGYMLRIKDGGPILVPETPKYALRHVYAGDVVRAVTTLINTGKGKGQAYNISQDEVVSLQELLSIICEIMGVDTPELVEIKRLTLEANGFLPDCSPFSDRWMSELTNDLSKAELGMVYTPLRTYLERIIHHYTEHPPRKPASYRRRNAERNLALQGENE
jgi:nucleoside-diphosphate-sugar epimerase